METIYIRVQNKHHRRGKFAAFVANWKRNTYFCHTSSFLWFAVTTHNIALMLQDVIFFNKIDVKLDERGLKIQLSNKAYLLCW